MHSRVFEISRSPIEIAQRLDPYELPEWFCSGIADYVDNTREEDREEELNWFTSRFGGHCKRSGNTVVFDPDTKKDYFQHDYAKFREAAAILAVCDYEDFCGSNPVSDFEMTIRQLKSSYEDQFGFYVYDRDNEELMTMDSWIRQTDLSGPLYVGGIVDYHW